MEPKKHPRLQAIGLGLALLATTGGLTWTEDGLDYVFGQAFTLDSPGALLFWLAQALLIAPAALLIGYGAAPALEAPLRRLWAQVQATPARTARLLLLLLGALTTAAAYLGNQWILRGFPITDDEIHARFGGQVLAMGRFSAPVLEPLALRPPRFLHQAVDQAWSSFDWAGLQLAWAISELTHTGPLLFSLVAGLTAASVAASAHLLLRHKGWALVATALFLGSPMALAMSLTTHAHLLSRGALALATLGLLLAWERHPRWALLAGLAAGLGGITRPAECALLLGPLLLALVADAARGRAGMRQALGLFVLGALPPLLFFALHNAMITGSPLLPPRLSAQAHSDGFPDMPLSYRFGANFAYNTLMLALWFGGPLGLGLFLLGIQAHRYTKLMAAGVGLLLLLALSHVITGINLFGPIHYTECAVPMALVATLGAQRALAWMKRHQLPHWQAAAALAVALGLTALLVNGHNLAQYERQSRIHSYIHGFLQHRLAEAGTQRAVIFAPRYRQVWLRIPAAKEVGSYVYDWPRANPDGSDPVVFMEPPRDSQQMAQVARTWPQHPPFVLRNLPQAPWLELVPFAEATSPRP